METEACYWIFCFKPIEADQGYRIFGYSEFLTAIALLVVIYTIVDVRYKFRIAITPGPLYVTTYSLIAVIGVETLFTDIWITEGWWVPKSTYLTQSVWQGIFGLLFLSIFLTWMYYAFIKPPIFCKRNALKFGQELYRYILRGNEEELKVIANELARSSRSLIKSSRIKQNRKNSKDSGGNKEKKKGPDTKDYAHDIFLLIANRKFCKQIVSSSPVTAQAIFEDMVSANIFNLPIGQFGRNITSEAISQKNSFLYEEAEGFYSGLMGYLKPVSQAIYGNYPLVENLASHMVSPLDVHYKEQWSWDAEQWEAYCRATLITMKDYLERGYGENNSFALNRAMHDMEVAVRDLHDLNDTMEIVDNDIYGRLRVISEFIKDAVALIDGLEEKPEPLYRVHEGTYPKNIYDHIALMFFNLCFSASTVNSPSDVCWSVHHNMVWTTLFDNLGDDKKALKIVRHKVRRLLYDEIKRLEEWPNYKGSRILGFCLNVLGVEIRTNKQGYGSDSYALACAVQSWARKNYLRMKDINPDVAESVLIGSITFDDEKKALVKTYIKGLNREAPKEYLSLELPSGQ